MDPLTPDQQRRLQRALDAALPPAPSAGQVEQALAAAKMRRAAKTAPRVAGRRTVGRTTRQWPVVGIVAMACALAVAAFGVSRWSATTAPSATAWREYTTERGQRAQVTLADGTIVTLAPATSMRVSTDLTRDRGVELSGAALFVVAHDPARRFVVRSGNAVTTVLGTTFAVRKYAEDSAATVVVSEGRVGVNAVLLTPGDAGVVGSTGVATVRRHVDLNAVLGWTHGKLVFRNVPLADVAAEMGRWYGVQVVVADDVLARRPVNVVLDRPTLTPERLDVFARGIDARITQAGDVITITPR